MRELLPGDPARLGPYEIRSRIGSGGMGVVYLGRSPSGRLAAVKRVRPEIADDAEFRTRFRREIDAARQVSGAFTAAVLDADADAGLPWLATAYVEGPSLRERVADAGPLPLREARRLGSGLAEALADLHRVGLVHRDIKPGNVLLAADGPRLIDFGIMRSDTLSELTDTGFVLGSAGYMAPEQAAGEHTGPPADVFSLGAVLTFATTGRGPFGLGTAATLLLRTVNEEPDVSAVPEELRGVVLRCLADDPADRPSGRDLVALLAPDASPLPDWERPRPVTARRAGTPRQYPGQNPIAAQPYAGPASASQASAAAWPAANQTPAAPLPNRLTRMNPLHAVPYRLPAAPPVMAQSIRRLEAGVWADPYQPLRRIPSRRAVLGWATALTVGGGLFVSKGCSSGTASTPSSYPGPVTGGRSSAPEPKPLWRTAAVTDDGFGTAGVNLALSPRGVLLAMTGNGLAGVDPVSGNGLWFQKTAPLPTTASVAGSAPLVADRTAYICVGGQLVAVSDSDHSNVLWQTDVAPLSQARVLGRAGGTLVLWQGSSDGWTPQRVLTVDETDHSRRWSLEPAPMETAVLATNGLLIRADPGAAKITAYQPADGKVVWDTAYRFQPGAQSSMVATAGLVCVGGQDLTVLDADTGKTVSAVPSQTGEQVVAAADQVFYTLEPAAADGATYQLACHDLYSGTKKWTAALVLRLSVSEASFAVAESAVIVAAPGSRQITAVDRTTGGLLWQVAGLDAAPGPAPYGYSLAADAGHVYVGTASDARCYPLPT